MAYEESELRKARRDFSYSHTDFRKERQSEASYRAEVEAYKIEHHVVEWMAEEKYSADFSYLICIQLWCNTTRRRTQYDRKVFKYPDSCKLVRHVNIRSPVFFGRQ